MPPSGWRRELSMPSECGRAHIHRAARVVAAARLRASTSRRHSAQPHVSEVLGYINASSKRGPTLRRARTQCCRRRGDAPSTPRRRHACAESRPGRVLRSYVRDRMRTSNVGRVARHTRAHADLHTHCMHELAPTCQPTARTHMRAHTRAHTQSNNQAHTHTHTHP